MIFLLIYILLVQILDQKPTNQKIRQETKEDEGIIENNIKRQEYKTNNILNYGVWKQEKLIKWNDKDRSKFQSQQSDLQNNNEVSMNNQEKYIKEKVILDSSGLVKGNQGFTFNADRVEAENPYNYDKINNNSTIEQALQIDTTQMDSRPNDPFYSAFPDFQPFYVQDIYQQPNSLDNLIYITKKYPKAKNNTSLDDKIRIKQLMVNVKQQKFIYSKEDKDVFQQNPYFKQ